MSSVVVVDGNLLVRESIVLGLQRHPDLCVIGDAGDAESAIAKVEQLRPDVMVLDAALPNGSGVRVVQELRRRGFAVRVLMLSAEPRLPAVARSLAAGADGYALQTESLDQVADAIRVVARGGEYLAPGLRRAELTQEIARCRGGRADPLADLTARELEIFNQLVLGLSNKQVGSRLFISVKTVETHRAHIFTKLSVHSIVELLRFAVANGVTIDGAAG